MKKLNLENKKFGKLIAIKDVGRYKSGGRLWECLCDCGNIVYARANRLTIGAVKSCGCGKYPIKHGHAKGYKRSSEYESWNSMKKRCLNPNTLDYKNYGGRGISIYSEWVNSFKSFIDYIGLKPDITYSLDRINSDGNYEPGNVRWANPKEQRLNQRPKVFKSELDLAYEKIDELESLIEIYNIDSGDSSIQVSTWLCGPPTSHGQFQQYPSRFIYNVKRNYPEMLLPESLHMFSGASDLGVTTDYREETGADIIAPFDNIPLEDSSVPAVIADPPYADHWQGQWHGDLPKPKHILREAVRLVKPGGLIGILHIIIIPAYKELGVQRIALHPVLTGPNNAIRVFNVFKKIDIGE